MGHRLEQRQRHPLASRGENEDVGGCEEAGHVGPEPERPDRRPGAGRDRRLERPVPGDEQDDVGAPGAGKNDRLDRRERILPRFEPAGE